MSYVKTTTAYWRQMGQAFNVIRQNNHSILAIVCVRIYSSLSLARTDAYGTASKAGASREVFSDALRIVFLLGATALVPQ